MMQENVDVLLSDLQVNFVEFRHEQMNSKIGHDFTINFNSIQLVCDGYGWITVDNQMYHLEKGDLVLLPANIVQSYGPTDGKPYILKYFCHFYMDIGNQNLFDLIAFDPVVKAGDYKKVLSVFNNMESIYSVDDLVSILKKKQMVLELVELWLESQPKTPSLKKPEDNITIKIAEYINNNISKNITVAELAALLGYNVNYFISLFKSFTNMTPKQYIINVKLKRALLLLRNKSLSISEIAEQIGFLNQYYFSTCFKKNYGLSPSQYRDILIKGND